MQNFVVIGWAYIEPEHSKFLSNLEFQRNTVSGTGTQQYCFVLLQSHKQYHTKQDSFKNCKMNLTHHTELYKTQILLSVEFATTFIMIEDHQNYA